jgi:predicted permease
MTRWLRLRRRNRAEEVQAHLDLYVDELIARGRTPDEARRLARLEFGNPRARIEELEGMSRVSWLDTLGRDLRYGARVLRRSPIFTATAVATLALVIGACTAVFSLADALLFKPLPYPQPDRLAFVTTTTVSPRSTWTSTGQDNPVYEAVRDRIASVDAAAYSDFSGGGVNLVVGEQATFVKQSRVSAGYFRVLGVAPFKGREFTRDEDRPGAPLVAILSHGLWQRAFQGDEDIVGKPILLRGQPYTVAGVMPASFVPPSSPADIWTPLRPTSTGEGAGTNYAILARLRDGVTWEQARAELAAASVRDLFTLRQLKDDATATLGLAPLQATINEGAREPIAMLGAAVATVLVIACVNLAALMLARGGARAKEIATRMALGSGRRAVVRQLMVEAALIAIAGGAAGLFVGSLALQMLRTIGASTFGDVAVSLDARAIAATAGLSLLTSLVVGLVPALQASRIDVQQALVEGGSRGVAGGRRHWPRRLLLISEVALGVVLLVLAGLLLRTFVNLRSLDPGFDPRGIVTARVSLQDARYNTRDRVVRLVDDSLAQLSATPGIDAAGVSLGLPNERLLNMGFRFADAPPETTGVTANVSYVTPGFFDALRIPMKGGRRLSDLDRQDTPPVVLVNETFVRVYGGGLPAVGRQIRLSGAAREIVGVVGDVQQRGSGFYVEGMTTGPIVGTPSIYLPLSQTNDGLLRTVHTWFTPVWAVRARSMTDAEPAIRRAIAAADPLMPVQQAQPMSSVIAASMSQQRLLMTLVGVLAGSAVLLAAIGLHGLVAHGVAERRREFGIRLALGATPAATMRGVVFSGVALAAIGAAAGGALSLLAVRLVESSLWNVSTHDPTTYAGVMLLLLVVSATASAIPAMRILRLDPVETLRG